MEAPASAYPWIVGMAEAGDLMYVKGNPRAAAYLNVPNP